MKPPEWMEVVEWIADRFPDKPWAAEQAVAYYYDLEEFDTTDVWTGIMALYEEGQRFTPNGSQILAATRKARRQAALADRYMGVPEEKREALAAAEWTWDEYSKKQFGEVLTFQQAIERGHAKLKPCGNPRCEIHYPINKEEPSGATY